MKLLLNLTIIILLSGCSSLSKEECVSTNWFNLGKSDAVGGEVEPKTAQYRRACSEHGLQIKSMEYLKGFEVGLKSYCTYSNGLDRGEDGEDAHSLCEEANPEYKKGYQVGYREFKKKESIVELKKKLIEDNGGMECTFSSDCKMKGSCSFGKCERSKKECSFDSDCEYEGRCDSVSDWTDYNDRVKVDVCKAE